MIFAVALLAFASLGLPDGVLGVAWPSVRAAFRLSVGELGVLVAVTMVGCLGSSVSGGWVVARLGIGRLLVWSSALMVAHAVVCALALEPDDGGGRPGRSRRGRDRPASMRSRRWLPPGAAQLAPCRLRGRRHDGPAPDDGGAGGPPLLARGLCGPRRIAGGANGHLPPHTAALGGGPARRRRGGIGGFA
jgi:MFS family permease